MDLMIYSWVTNIVLDKFASSCASPTAGDVSMWVKNSWRDLRPLSKDTPPPLHRTVSYQYNTHTNMIHYSKTYLTILEFTLLVNLLNDTWIYTTRKLIKRHLNLHYSQLNVFYDTWIYSTRKLIKQHLNLHYS